MEEDNRRCIMAKPKPATTHNFRVMHSDFSCPLAPEIPWHWGLRYKECPLAADQRNLSACKACDLRGVAFVQQKKRKQRREITPERKKDKGPIPKIGGSYVSE